MSKLLDKHKPGSGKPKIQILKASKARIRAYLGPNTALNLSWRCKLKSHVFQYTFYGTLDLRTCTVAWSWCPARTPTLSATSPRSSSAMSSTAWERIRQGSGCATYCRGSVPGFSAHDPGLKWMRSLITIAYSLGADQAGFQLRNFISGFCSGFFRAWSGSEMDASFNNCRILIFLT